MYPGLTHGAYSAILHGGSDAQKALYLPPLASGRWAGTMNLTEPQCGTDLGLLRTKAVPAGDGTYKISGQKIWISGGEHDLAENIVHLVLARIEGAPAGTRGISLFIVPKFIADQDGTLGARNGVTCAGLEEKMGIHGNATCVMVYDEAIGWLVGEENRGLALMFVMMNEARLGVGLQGLAQGEAAYQAAAAFARERLQGRSLTGPKNPEGRPIRSWSIPTCSADADGRSSRARRRQGLPVVDRAAGRPGAPPSRRRRAPESVGLLGLMTPVPKAFLTDRGFAICSDAMQVHRGAPGSPSTSRSASICAIAASA